MRADPQHTPKLVEDEAIGCVVCIEPGCGWWVFIEDEPSRDYLPGHYVEWRYQRDRTPIVSKTTGEIVGVDFARRWGPDRVRD